MTSSEEIAFMLHTLLVCLVMAQTPAQPGAARPADTKPAESRPAPKEPAVDETPVVTQHRITLNGEEISYTATAALMPIRERNGETEAHIFYVAYTRTDLPK